MTVAEAIKRAEELKLEDPEKADALYRKIIEARPGALEAWQRYLEFLNASGRWAEAIELADELLGVHPEQWEASLWKAFGLVALGRADEALDAFVYAFAVAPKLSVAESHYVYFLNLLGLAEGFDYERLCGRLERTITSEPRLEESGAAAALRRTLEQRMRQVYAADRHVSGFVLFVDLVDSSKYKREHPDTWRRRIVHFLMYTRYAFAYLGFEFLKFIGDEVMMFMPLGEDGAALAAKTVYDFVVRNGWYLEQLNLFNPASLAESGGRDEHGIQAKVFIGEVREALVFQPSEVGPYDLVGEDLDRAARIKEQAQPDLFVADQGFRKALRSNGGAYSEAFSTLAREGSFKGIGGRTAFFGERIPRPKASGRASQ